MKLEITNATLEAYVGKSVQISNHCTTCESSKDIPEFNFYGKLGTLDGL